MNYGKQFMHDFEDKKHHESDESDEWKQEKTSKMKVFSLRSFLWIRSIRQIRGAFTLSLFETWPVLFPGHCTGCREDAFAPTLLRVLHVVFPDRHKRGEGDTVPGKHSVLPLS